MLSPIYVLFHKFAYRGKATITTAYIIYVSCAQAKQCFGKGIIGGCAFTARLTRGKRELTYNKLSTFVNLDLISGAYCCWSDVGTTANWPTYHSGAPISECIAIGMIAMYSGHDHFIKWIIFTRGFSSYQSKYIFTHILDYWLNIW